MKPTSSRLLLFALVLTLLNVLLACQNPLTPVGVVAVDPENMNPEELEANGLAGKPGTLLVSITSSPASTLLPGIDMTPVSYIVSGKGPGGSTFATPRTTGSPVAINDLKAGSWWVTVDALNAGEIIVGRSQSVNPVKVLAGQNTPVTIAVKPFAGYGTLNLTVTWKVADCANPNVTAQLVPSAGSPLALSFKSATPGTALYSSSTISTGYHTLVLQIEGNGIPVQGVVETIYVVKDQVTSGTLDFRQSNAGGGLITVSLTPRPDNPIAVTLSGQAKEIAVGSTMTVTASVPAKTGSVVYTWYLNGALKASGSSYTIANTLPAGFYRLSGTAVRKDGSRAGSASHSFQVKSSQMTQASLVWDPNSEPDLAGYKIHYGTSSKNYNSVVDVGNQTTYTLSGLQAGKTYYISATAYNRKGLESGYSNEIVFTGT